MPELFRKTKNEQTVTDASMVVNLCINAAGSSRECVTGKEFQAIQLASYSTVQSGMYDMELRDFITPQPSCFHWEMIAPLKDASVEEQEEAAKGNMERETDAAEQLVHST